MKYIILLLTLFLLIHSEKTPWTYTQCSDYLNNLNIICHTFNKNNNGVEICKKWEVKSKTDIDNLPKECFNKKYNLEVYIKYSNPPLKRKLFIFLDFYEKINFVDKEKYELEANKLAILLLSKEIDNIKECFKNFIKYEKICTERDNIDEKDEELCNEVKIKKNTKFCTNIMNIFDKNFISELRDVEDFDDITNKLKDDNNKIKQIKNIYEGYNDKTNNYLYNKEQNNNKDEIGKINNDNKKNDYYNELKFEKQNDDNNKDFNNNNINNDDYDISSRKDCVEYGLKEDYIFCTKYE